MGLFAEQGRVEDAVMAFNMLKLNEMVINRILYIIPNSEDVIFAVLSKIIEDEEDAHRRVGLFELVLAVTMATHGEEISKT